MKLSLHKPRLHVAGVEQWCHSFLTTALDGGERSASRPGRFSLGGKEHPILEICVLLELVVEEDFFNCVTLEDGTDR